MSRFVVLAAALVFAIGQGIVSAVADTFPTRTVRVIVPFGPGSGADVTTRLLGERLSKKWGHPMVVENRPGGDGFVAINAFVNANDDHTLLYIPVALFAVHPYTHQKLTYDADRDLLPVASGTAIMLSIASSNSFKAKTLREAVDLLRANPGKFNAAAAAGNSEFLLSGFLKDQNLDVGRVPYRDITQAPRDLVEGSLHLLVSSLIIVQPLMKDGGGVNILAVTSRQRAPSVPNVPTVREAGFPELELDSTLGFFGRRGMPLATRQRIAADVQAVVEADPSIRTKLEATGQFVTVQGPEDFAARIKELRSQLDGIAKTLGMKKLQ